VELQSKEAWGTLAAEFVNTDDLLRALTVFLRIGLHGLVLTLSGSQRMLMIYSSVVHVSFFLRLLSVFLEVCCLENCARKHQSQD